MKIYNSVRKFMYTVGASALVLPTLAMAQTATRDEEVEEVEFSETDIIVSATKREQTLQDTPVSVAVTSADTIEKAAIRDLIDLQTVAPSLRVTQLQSSANTNFIIRGFGNGANNAGIEPSVGVFIDGVYRSRSAAQIGDLAGIQRVEVLRGPQSTLFGKNASAGVISIVTKKPQSEFGGSVEASYGNYNALVLKGDVTGPIGESMAFSLGGNFNRRDGYAKDLFRDERVNERNRFGTRGQLLIEPSSALSIRVIADFDKIDEDCCVAGNILNGATGAIIQALSSNRGIDANNPFSYRVYNNFASSNKIKNSGISGQVDYDFGNLTLTSITAKRGVGADTNQDSDFTGADLIGRNSQNLKVRTFTQELRLTSDFDGKVNFLLGGYYFDEGIKQRNNLLFGTQFRPYGNQLIVGATGGALSVTTLESTFGLLEGNPSKYTNAFFRAGDGMAENYRLKNKSASLFGTVDFEITDKLKLTGGFNYTSDKKRFSANVTTTDVFSAVNFDAPAYAPFRNQLLVGGFLGQAVGQALNLGRSATQAEITTFATTPATAPVFAAINAQAVAFGAANQNNPAANPLNGLRAFQFLPPFLNVPNPAENGRTKDNDLSWTARLAYEFSDNLNVYASYATGFKASSVNLSRDSRPTAAVRQAAITGGYSVPNLGVGTRLAGPEEAEVYEIGIKGRLSTFAFNLALFDQTLKGFQSNIFGGTGFSLTNAGSQSVRGFELDTSFSPVKPLTLTGAITYLDSKYDSFIKSGIFVNGVEQNLTGKRPAGIPKFSFQGSATYAHEFGNGSTVAVRADYAHESKVQVVDNIPGVFRTQDNVNASLTYGMENGLEIGIWVRNLLKDKYLLSAFPSVAQSGSLSGYPNLPRTYGATARFKF